MGTEYETLFARLPQEVPVGLAGRVESALARERARARQLRKAGFVASLGANVLSLAGLFLAVPRLISASQETGFLPYASLLRTDSSVVFAHASSFALGLLEALPAIEVALTLFLASVFLATLRGAFRFGSPHAVTRPALA